MEKLIYILLISSFGLTIISCGEKDEHGSSSSSSDTTAATSDNTTLSAPSDLSATLGYYQVALDWTAVSGASSYTVYWDNATGISSSSTAITGITDDNYTHTGLDNGTTYYYKVATVNSAGTGSLSSEVSATPRTGPTVTEACTYGEAASGTVTDLIRANASGTYYHHMGTEISDGCIDNETLVASEFSMLAASGTKGVRHAAIIQGNGNAFMDSWNMYTGDNCTKQSGFLSFYYDNLTVSDNITIANPPTNYPHNATKVLYKKNYICVLAETAAQETTLETLFQGGLSLTVGTVYDSPNGTVGAMDNVTTLMTVLDNLSSTSLNYLYTEDNEVEATYPDNFTDQSGGTIWYAGDNITK